MPVPIRSLTQWMYITFIAIWFHVTPDNWGPFVVTRLVQKHGLLTNPTACSTRPMHYTTPSTISGCKTTLECDLKKQKLLLTCLQPQHHWLDISTKDCILCNSNIIYCQQVQCTSRKQCRNDMTAEIC